jgi:nitrite reductase (NADH) small subunit
MPEFAVCKAGDLQVGSMVEVVVDHSPIIVSRLPSGALRAIGGKCPHQGASLKYGCISGLTTSSEPNQLRLERCGEILRCPWHGFEFSLVDGASIVPYRRSRLRLRLYEVRVVGDEVVVYT